MSLPVKRAYRRSARSIRSRPMEISSSPRPAGQKLRRAAGCAVPNSYCLATKILFFGARVHSGRRLPLHFQPLARSSPGFAQDRRGGGVSRSSGARPATRRAEWECWFRHLHSARKVCPGDICYRTRTTTVTLFGWHLLFRVVFFTGLVIWLPVCIAMQPDAIATGAKSIPHISARPNQPSRQQGAQAHVAAFAISRWQTMSP